MKSLKPSPSVKSRALAPHKLLEVYRVLRKAQGHQHWWPGETPFEVMVGAILTQNTAWTNVEKAIRNLKSAKKLSPKALREISLGDLARLIRPAGYFNIKARRLKNFIEFIFKEYGGDLKRMLVENGELLREKLLSVNGIGPETADSILLYAARKPFFVMDAYTKRIFSRHRLRNRSWIAKAQYGDWQSFFTQSLPRSLPLFNDYHAQIVNVAKQYCHSFHPLCNECPLKIYL